MGRLAIHPSAALAKLIQDRRRELGMSLRDVQRETEALGLPIPYATLSKIELGKADPGAKRLFTLLRLFDLPMELAGEILEMEEFAADQPAASTPVEELKRRGIEHWREGRLREGMACLLAMRQRLSKSDDATVEHQKALLAFSVAAKNFGKIRLARQVVDELLVAGPHQDLLVDVLVHGAVCWHALGSTDAALAFLMRAEAALASGDSRRRAWIAHERARCHLTRGELEEAERSARDAVTAYEEAEDRYGSCQCIGTRIQIATATGDHGRAIELASQGQTLAAANGFGRLRLLRRIDEGRARVRAGDAEAGAGILQEALGEAIAENDHVLAFYGHYGLWRAYTALGNPQRAAAERTAAEYFARFVDVRAPEIDAIKGRARPKRRR